MFSQTVFYGTWSLLLLFPCSIRPDFSVILSKTKRGFKVGSWIEKFQGARIEWILAISYVAIHLTLRIESQIYYKFSGEDKSTDCVLYKRYSAPLSSLCVGSSYLKWTVNTIVVCLPMALNQLPAIVLQDLSLSTVFFLLPL